MEKDVASENPSKDKKFCVESIYGWPPNDGKLKKEGVNIDALCLCYEKEFESISLPS